MVRRGLGRAGLFTGACALASAALLVSGSVRWALVQTEARQLRDKNLELREEIVEGHRLSEKLAELPGQVEQVRLQLDSLAALMPPDEETLQRELDLVFLEKGLRMSGFRVLERKRTEFVTFDELLVRVEIAPGPRSCLERLMNIENASPVLTARRLEILDPRNPLSTMVLDVSVILAKPHPLPK